MELLVTILLLLFFGLHIWAVNNRNVMKVLAVLYAISIILGLFKGGYSIALIIPCVVCFWRANRPISSPLLDFFGLLFTMSVSGSIIGLMEGRRDNGSMVIIACISAILSTLCFILCERKSEGKSIIPKFERKQPPPQQPIYPTPIIIQQPIPMNFTTVTQSQTVETPKKKESNLIGKEYYTEPMYDRLIRLCNPANFVDNYDKEKVNIANAIYSKLLSTNRQDQDTLFELVEIAESKLGLNLLDEWDYNDLKSKLNPKNFVQPYDAEKVSLSNELYSQLMQSNINLTKFMDVKDKAKPLFPKREDEQLKQEDLENKPDVQNIIQSNDEKWERERLEYLHSGNITFNN